MKACTHTHTQYAPFLILHISLYAEDATTKSDDSAELQENRACTDQSLQPTTTLQRANQQTEYVLLNASQSGSLSGTTYWYQPSTSPVLLSAFIYSRLVASYPPALFYFLLGSHTSSLIPLVSYISDSGFLAQYNISLFRLSACLSGCLC